MAQIVDVQVVGAQALIVRFGLASVLIMDRVERAVSQATLRMEGIVKDGKLSGQVLNRITGNLRASIFSTQPPERTATKVTGRVQSDGSVKYAAIHEFGFDGDETVHEHMRHVVFGREVAPFVVPEFTRHMVMPERSFMRSTFTEEHERAEADIAKAVDEGVAAIAGKTV
jgi:phage gpG-like protein